MAGYPQVYLLRSLRAHELQGEVPVVCLWVGDDEVGRGRRGTQRQGVALEEGCRGGGSLVIGSQRACWSLGRMPPIPVVQLSEALKLSKGEAAVTQATTEVLAIAVWKGGRSGSVPGLHLKFTPGAGCCSLWPLLAQGLPGPFLSQPGAPSF